MNKILLILFIIVTIASLLNAASVLSTKQDELISKVCDAVSNTRGLAMIILNKLEKVFASNNNKQYPRSNKYITEPTNRNKLSNGGYSCTDFFNGLQAPLKADLVDNGETITDIAQRFKQFIQEKIGQFGS